MCVLDGGKQAVAECIFISHSSVMDNSICLFLLNYTHRAIYSQKRPPAPTSLRAWANGGRVPDDVRADTGI